MVQLKTTAVLLALLASAGAGAQQATYKCTDKAGKVTYSSTECHLLGLKGQGEVVDRMNTSPAYKPPAGASAPKAPAAASAPKPAAKAAEPAATGSEDEADPNRRCFKVKTATGFATRCNERPAEDEPKKP